MNTEFDVVVVAVVVFLSLLSSIQHTYASQYNLAFAIWVSFAPSTSIHTPCVKCVLDLMSTSSCIDAIDVCVYIGDVGDIQSVWERNSNKNKHSNKNVHTFNGEKEIAVSLKWKQQKNRETHFPRPINVVCVFVCFFIKYPNVCRQVVINIQCLFQAVK